MTEISMTAQDAAPVKTREDVIRYYRGVDDNPLMPDRLPKIGIEIESTAYDSVSLAPLGARENEALVAAGREIGMPVHYEPSATLVEIISDPFPRSALAALLEQIDARFYAMVAIAARRGIAFSPFGHLPHVKAKDHILIQNERYRTMWNPCRADMEAAFHSFLYPSIQTSISYDNADQLLRIIRLCVALEPLALLLTDASAGIFEGAPIDNCPWMFLRNRRGPNGGIPDFYYAARSGTALIDAHIDHTFNHGHLFVFFDNQGRLRQLPSGTWMRFSALEAQNLGPRNFLNYRQAQSESWRRACNISTINDAGGRVIGHRAEMNFLSTGLQHQRASAALLCYSVAFCSRFYPRITALLHDFGINIEALDESRPLLEKNFDAACNHAGRFHDLPFGTGSMKDFALGFADIWEKCYEGRGFDDCLAPALHILRSGRPDWLVWRETFTTPESLKIYLENFPAFSRDNPDLLSAKSCADLALPALRKHLA